MKLVNSSACHSFWKLGHILSQLTQLQKQSTRVCYYSSKQFSIADIAKANHANKSFDGTKKPVTKKTTVKSKAKSSKGKDVEAKNSCGADDKSADTADIPEWFQVVLNSPFYPEGNVNADEMSEFKLFLEEIELKTLPSVTKIIKETEPKHQTVVLQKWKDRKTKELGGEEQFRQYQQAILDKGSNLHGCIEMKLQGETDITVHPKSQGHWESMQHVLGHVHDVKVMEQQCVHPEMFYKGKFDCIANYKDTLCLIEWKTSSTLKPLLSNTYDNPLQVAAYIGAVNRGNLIKQLEIPKITSGALVIAYESGEPATIHLMNRKLCEKYWNQWLNRLFLYWTTLYRDRVTQQ